MHKLSPVSLVECIFPLFCRALYHPRTTRVGYKRAGCLHQQHRETWEIIQLSPPWGRLWSELQTIKTDTWFFFPPCLKLANSVDLCSVNMVVLSSPWKPLQYDWPVCPCKRCRWCQKMGVGGLRQLKVPRMNWTFAMADLWPQQQQAMTPNALLCSSSLFNCSSGQLSGCQGNVGMEMLARFFRGC